MPSSITATSGRVWLAGRLSPTMRSIAEGTLICS
jgi:hypothetical protein